MITPITNDNCRELYGRSTDKKPIGKTAGGSKIGNGSIFTEVDTGKVYMYDEEHKVWLLQKK